MTCYIKLVPLAEGVIRDVKDDVSKYLNPLGLEFFERKKWKHAYVRIPKAGVDNYYKKRYKVYAIETNTLTVGKIADHRSNFPHTRIEVTTNNRGLMLYAGKPSGCPEHLRNREVISTMYTGRTLYMEVAHD